MNSITLSDSGNSSGAEIIGNIANTVPYAGAVNHVRFETDQRQSYVFSARKADGGPLPFGAEVTDRSGSPIGFVGQASTIHIKHNELPDYVLVRLSDGTCTIQQPKPVTNTSINSCD